MDDERRIGVSELQRQISHVEDQLGTVREQLAVVISNQQGVMRQLGETTETLRTVVVEIGGAPVELGRDTTRRSIRRRLHDLENDRSAAQAAAAAVSASKQIYQASTDRRFSRREKFAGILLAAVVALGPYVAPFFH